MNDHISITMENLKTMVEECGSFHDNIHKTMEGLTSVVHHINKAMEELSSMVEECGGFQNKIRNTVASLEQLNEECAASQGVEIYSQYSPPASPVKTESIATIHPSSHEQVCNFLLKPYLILFFR